MQLDDYLTAHSDPEPDYLAVINRKTHLQVLNPRMLSGHLQGRVLAMLSKMIQPTRILEIGTFTAYSALCLAEGLTYTGIVHTIESDDELEEMIHAHIALSPYKEKIKVHIGDARALLPGFTDMFDLVFMDGDKREYCDYLELVLPILRNGGFILADNTLWDGKVLSEKDTNDFQTESIKIFNQKLAEDTRVEKVMLPLRDGLTLIRKI